MQPSETGLARIHFVNRYGHPDHSATSQTLSGIAFDLARRGHEVHVAASRQLYESPAARLPRREVIDGVSIVRLWSARFGRSGLVGRLLDYLTFYIAAACHLLFVLRPGDLVVVKTDPPMLSVLAVPIARLKGAKCVAWMQDVFPEIASALGVGGRLGAGVCAVLRRLRNWSLARADRVVVIGDGMARHMIAEGVASARIVVIPNWADPDLVRPVAHADNPLRRDWGLDDCIVVGYCGNLGRVHDVDTLAAAISFLQRGVHDDPARPPLAFVFVGGGANRAVLEDRLEALGVAGVQFRPYQTADRLAETLSAIDIHLVSLLPRCEGLVLPSKIYGVMAAARPVVFVGDPDGDVGRLVAQERLGYAVAAGAAQALAAAITELAKDTALRDEMGGAARRAFEATFTLGASSASWHRLACDLLGHAREARAVRGSLAPPGITRGN